MDMKLLKSEFNAFKNFFGEEISFENDQLVKLIEKNVLKKFE
jgi:hypothetical protein